MRHIQDKYDWAYEMRPQILTAFGVFGILHCFNTNKDDAVFSALSTICGLVLFAIAYKISQWRREYRKNIL